MTRMLFQLPVRRITSECRRTILDESVSTFAVLDAPAFGLRIVQLVPHGATSCTIDPNF